MVLQYYKASSQSVNAGGRLPNSGDVESDLLFNNKSKGHSDGRKKYMMDDTSYEYNVNMIQTLQNENTNLKGIIKEVIEITFL
jgi:hypothetical protein